MRATRGRQGIGMVTSSGLPWVAKRIREAARWITEGKDYAPATVVRMLRESRGNMQEFWYAWTELLDVACDKFDWSQPVVMDSDDREQYASANDFYRREVEPFLGPLERLQQVAGRYRSGEITHDEGKEQITKSQAIRQRRASQPTETQQQTADAVGCSRKHVVEVMNCVTKKSDSDKEVTPPEWIIRRDMQAAFRKLPAGERARLEALSDDQRRGSVRQAAIAAGIVKVPSVLDQLRKIWVKATDADRRTFMDEIKDGRSVVRAHPVADPPTGHSHWQGGDRADIEGVRHFLRGAPGDATEVVVMNYTVPVAGPLPHDPTSVAFVVGRRYLEHVSSADGSSWHAAYEVAARSAKFVTVARVGSSLEPERIKVRTDDGTEMLRLRGCRQLHATAAEDA